MPVSEPSGRRTGAPARTTSDGASGRQILYLALGGIGDTVLAIPAARRLRQVFAHDHLTALAMWTQSANVLEDLGIFDEVLEHNFQCSGPRASLRALVALRRRRFALSIIAFPANRFEYNVLHRLIGATVRLGHDYLRGSNLGYLRWLLTDRVQQTLGTHCVDENLKLVAQLEPASREWPLDHSLGPLAPEYREYASRVLDPARERYLGIHAGSSAYKNLDAKRWPAEHFAELCRRVSTEDGLVPLLFGTAQDREVNATIVKGCPATRIVETPSIRHTAALLQQCEALIANDTAIGHLGTALDVPVVMLTGPTDAREVGPCGPLGITVSTALVCSPCFRVSRRPLRCRHSERYACMKMIAVGRVLAALRAALGKRGTQRSYPLDTIAGNRVALDASKARSTETALNVS